MAPKFAQEPTLDGAMVIDSEVKLTECQTVAGQTIEWISIIPNGLVADNGINLQMSPNEGTKLNFEKIPILTTDERIFRRYEGIVLPDGWSLYAVPQSALASGSFTVLMGGAKLG